MHDFNDIRIIRDRIALESTVPGIAEPAFQRMFPTVVDYMKNLLHNVDVGLKALPMFFNSGFEHKVQKVRYLDVSPMVAFVPAGLVSDYLTYAPDLVAAAEHVAKFVKEELTAYSTYCAMIVSNRDQKFSTVDMDAGFQKMAAQREAVAAAMNKHFNPDSSETRKTIGDVVSRAGDWPQVLKFSKELSTIINHIDRNVIKKKTHEIEEYLGLIVKRIEKGEMDGASPEVVRGLADGAYQIASELQFYSIVYYRVLAFVEAIKATTDHFDKVIK